MSHLVFGAECESFKFEGLNCKFKVLRDCFVKPKTLRGLFAKCNVLGGQVCKVWFVIVIWLVCC